LQHIEIPLDLYIPRPPEEDEVDFDFTSAEKFRVDERMVINAWSFFA
jgi:hypothetical protein